jgi:hypothetical protein
MGFSTVLVIESGRVIEKGDRESVAPEKILTLRLLVFFFLCASLSLGWRKVRGDFGAIL